MKELDFNPYEKCGERPVRKDLHEIKRVGSWIVNGNGYYQTGYNIIGYTDAYVYITTWCTNEYGGDYDNDDLIEIKRSDWDALPDED